MDITPSTPPTDALLVDHNEAARLLSIGRTTVWRLVKSGDLEQINIGRRALITRESIERFARHGLS